MMTKDPTPQLPTSPSQPDSAVSSDKKPQEDESEAAESKLKGDVSVKPDISYVVADEVLRQRIRTLIEEKPKSSKFHSISTHPLIITFVGFILSIVLGGFITSYHSLKQKELEYERQRALAREQIFSEEFIKTRIRKINEVWEQIDKNEAILDDLVDRTSNTSGADKNDFDSIVKLIDEDVAIINKNRFWLGESTYEQLKRYSDINHRYVLNMLLARPGIDLSESLKQREQAKLDILKVRGIILNREAEPDK
jgi:hypothetical protein